MPRLNAPSLAVLASTQGIFREVPKICDEIDYELAKWTILRYLVIAVIVAYQVQKKMDKTGNLIKWPYAFFIAGCNFAHHEGVGFLIYFSVSALMDNFAIFFEDSHPYCGYVKMTALYSMSLVTFLPACWFAYRFQGTMFDEGGLMSKISFGIAMLLVTVLTFVVRLYLVYDLGYAKLVEKSMSSLSFKVIIAVLVPPVVDGLQTILLIACSLKSSHGKSEEATAPSCDDGAIT